MAKRINIVDDEPKVGELFTTVLERDGYEVHSYVNPRAMLDDIDEGRSVGRPPGRTAAASTLGLGVLVALAPTVAYWSFRADGVGCAVVC